MSVFIKNFTDINKTDCGMAQDSTHNNLQLDTYFFVPLYIIVILVSILGNIMIIGVVYKRPVMHTFTNILICNCAVSDLLITLFSAIFSVVDTLKTKGKWYIGEFMCSFVHFCVVSSVAANIVTLVVIAIDRLFAVTSPYKKILKNNLLFVIIPLVWIIAFGFASPLIYTQSVIYIEDYGPVCVEMWLPPFKPIDSPKYYTVVLFVCLYALPLASMVVMYGVISKELVFDTKIKLKFLFRRTSRQEQLNSQRVNIQLEGVDDDEGAKMANLLISGFRKRRVVCMLITMIIVFACCWLPVFMLQFLTTFHSYYSVCPGAIPDWAYALSYLMQYSNSAIDPILYFWFSGSYRKELRAFSQVLLSINIRFGIKW